MKVLFVQLRQIGDILMCTPAIRAFKERFPDSVVHFLCSGKFSSILEGNPFIDRIITVENQPRLADAIRTRKEKYDAVIDFMNLPKTALLAFATGSPIRVGCNKRLRTLFYTHIVNTNQEILYSALTKLLHLSSFGIKENTDLSINIFPSAADVAISEEISTLLCLNEAPKLCALSPVSRRDYKRWPLEKYARVCDIIHEKHDISFLPLFGPGESHFIDRLIQYSRHPEAFKYPYSSPSFKALFPLIKKCFFYFGNDNGIRHLAIAAKLPTATIFGIPNPEAWTPVSDITHRWVWGKENIGLISEDEVLDMLNSVLIDEKLSAK